MICSSGFLALDEALGIGGWPAGGKTIKAYKFYMEGMPQPAHIGYFGKDNDGDDIFLFRDRNQEGYLVHIKLYKTTD